MSIIVLKDSTIVADGRYSGQGFIIDDDFLKMVQVGEKLFFYVGTPAKLDLFTSHYCSGEFVPENQKETNMEAIVFDGCHIFNIWINNDNGEVLRVPIDPKKGFAIGSGAPHAQTALDIGYTAVEAVKMAIKRDYYCGGVIRQWSFKLNDNLDSFIFGKPDKFKLVYQYCNDPQSGKNESIAYSELQQELKKRSK